MADVKMKLFPSKEKFLRKKDVEFYEQNTSSVFKYCCDHYVLVLCSSLCHGQHLTYERNNGLDGMEWN